MDQVRTSIQNQTIGGMPHVEGRLVNPLVSPTIMLPDQQVIVLAQRIVEYAMQHYPNNRGGVMTMGLGEHQAHRYTLSIPQRNLVNFNYQKLVDNVEKMVNSNDAVLVSDVVLKLAVRL